MTTAITLNPLHEAHDEATHVERKTRLQAIEAALDASGLRPELLTLPVVPATNAQLLAVHEQRLIDTIHWTTSQDDAWFGMDTYTTRHTWEAARMSAGAAISAVDAVATGRVHNAFALSRPPGHHATPSQPMGFCFFNNIAVAARHAFMHHGIARLAIIDFDVHHGNGTQDCFYDDSTVLFCSSHASPLYPGTGSEHEVGLEDGYGTTLNIPLPYRTGDMGFRMLYDQVITPAVRRYRPEMILVSAGYDAHWDDPLGPLSLSVSGYTAITQRLVALANELCNGKIVMILEGGYSLPALSGSVLASLRVLLGHAPAPDPLGPADTAEPDLTTVIRRILDRHPIF